MKRVANRVVTAVMLMTIATAAQSQSQMKTIARGDVSNQDAPKQVVARTAEEWQTIWKAHSSTAPVPAVDFSANMVVGVFLGSRPSAGYGVEIVGTHSEGTALVIDYSTTQPGRGMMAAQMITEPFHLVSIPRHADPIRFVEKK